MALRRKRIKPSVISHAVKRATGMMYAQSGNVGSDNIRKSKANHIRFVRKQPEGRKFLRSEVKSNIRSYGKKAYL